jgi:hypothetical protein
MDANRVKIIVVSLVMLGTMSAPAVSSAQSYRYANDDRPAIVVECGPGQRAVMEQRRVDSGTQLVARCVTARTARAARAERAPQRSKTKTALMIAGSAASGAGVGGALKGKKGALVGAAVGGGAASVYEAIKRR